MKKQLITADLGDADVRSKMVANILRESVPSQKEGYLRDSGQLSESVRLDVPLRFGDEVIFLLRWMAEEFPQICDRIAREPQDRQLQVAQWELQAVRAKIGRKRR